MSVIEFLNAEVALVILNYNSARDSIALAENLLRHLSDRYSVVIVDNGSQDVPIVQQYVHNHNGISINGCAWFDFLCDRNRLWLIHAGNNGGYSKGNNIGLRFAYAKKYRYAFIVNPDVSVDDYSVFDGLLSIMNRKPNQIGIVGPKIMLPHGEQQGPIDVRKDWWMIVDNFMYPFSSIVRKIKRQIAIASSGHYDVYLVIGCFFALDLNIFHEIDYFDENVFLYYEEAIIADRLKKHGKKVCYTPLYQVRHNHTYRSDWTVDNIHYQKSKSYYEKLYLKNTQLVETLLEMSAKWKKKLKIAQ